MSYKNQLMIGLANGKVKEKNLLTRRGKSINNGNVFVNKTYPKENDSNSKSDEMEIPVEGTVKNTTRFDFQPESPDLDGKMDLLMDKLKDLTDLLLLLNSRIIKIEKEFDKIKDKFMTENNPSI